MPRVKAGQGWVWVIALLLAVPSAVAQSTTDTIAFQGLVSGSGGAAVADGAYRMQFRLFDAATGGAALWTETDFTVPVSGGRFTRQLGGIEPFPEGVFAEQDNLFLEIAVDVNNNGLDAGDIQSPRTPLNSAPSAFHAKDAALLGGIPAAAFAVAEGEAHVTVQTTGDVIENGARLQNAYAAAKALTPHGLPLSADNRAVLFVAPGRYDLGAGEVVLDTEFVDLIGLSSARENQYITGTSNGSFTGVIRQTANDVRIENLRVECTGLEGFNLFGAPSDPAAYFPSSNRPLTRVRNCEFVADVNNAFSMRTEINYAGTYIDCVAGVSSFGGFGGVASGTFINCTGSFQSFAGGTQNAIASGVFLNCSAGADSFGGEGGVASGRFTQCTADDNSFGGRGTASGVFEHCTGGNGAFGGAGGAASGKFVDCTGRLAAFGGLGFNAGSASGEFIDCRGEESAFGGGGAASGIYTNCVGLDNAFGGGPSGNSTGARLLGCRMTGTTWSGTFRGRMESSTWSANIVLGAQARLYSSTVLGNVDLNNTTAGIAQSRVRAAILNAGSAVFNTANVVNLDVD